MKFSEIKELIQAIDKSSVTKFCLENEEGKIEIKKEAVAVAAAPAAATVVAATAAPAANAPAEGGNFVKSPLVGVAYRRPKPDAEPFVSVGSQVKKGQTICIVEAMKMFNEIKAAQDGIIKEVLFEDGQLVEFDQPLFAWGE